MGLFTRYPTLKRVIVNTKTGQTFRGVLWGQRGGYLILRQAEMLKAKADPAPLDGDVLIHTSNLDFMQVIGQ